MSSYKNIENKDAGSCSALDEDECDLQVVVGSNIVFRWVTDNKAAEDSVHIALSDVDKQIELYSENSANYKSANIYLFKGMLYCG